MKTQTFVTSTCRCCNYYRPEGRRGGTCQQLNVPVRGCWKACSLSTPPFCRYPGHLDEEIVHLEQVLALDYLPSYSALELSNAEETRHGH